MFNRITAVLWALSMSACGPSESGRDAAVRYDARVIEGGLLDAGESSADGGLPDFDAGVEQADAGPALCSLESCDPRAADGCGEGSCVLWGETGSCEMGAGALGRDAECADVADCAPGLACFLVDGVGRCGRVCCPDDGAACSEGTCGGSGELVDGTVTAWGRCLARRVCDVHAPDEVCEPREGCYIIDALGGTECRVAGTSDVGDRCEVQEDCLAGLFCGGVGGDGPRCIRICRIGEEDCGPREACVAQAHTPDGSGLCVAATKTP